MTTIPGSPASDASGASSAEASLLAADRRFAAEVAAASSKERAAVWAGWFAPDGRQVTAGAVVIGPDLIARHMEPYFAAQATLAWEPDTARAADDGRSGWTSGRYESRDADGRGALSRGRYVSFWRLCDDGRWRVELDTGIPDMQP